MLVGRRAHVDRVVQQPGRRVDAEPVVLHRDAVRLVVRPVERPFVERRRRRIQADAEDLVRAVARRERVGRRDVALAVGETVDDLHVFHLDVVVARRQETEPAARLDVELAFLADLDLVVGIRRRRVVLGAGAELFLRQVVADDAGAQRIDRVVVGARQHAVAARLRRREPQRRAVTQRDLTGHVGTEGQVVVRRIQVLADLEVQVAALPGTDDADVAAVHGRGRRYAHGHLPFRYRRRVAGRAAVAG